MSMLLAGCLGAPGLLSRFKALKVEWSAFKFKHPGARLAKIFAATPFFSPHLLQHFQHVWFCGKTFWNLPLCDLTAWGSHTAAAALKT
jgi:hypothetical protein